MSRPGVFVDRDGTVSREKGYINHVDRFCLYPDSAKGIKKLNDAGVPVCLITNQAGVARGYFPFELVRKVHARMAELLKIEGGAVLDGVYYCPHHKDGVVDPYSITCDCRKPGTGLVEKAAEELDLDLKRSFMVGDKISDVELGKKMGGYGILVKTGYGQGELEYYRSDWKVEPDYIAKDLQGAIDWILTRLGKDK